MDLRDYVAALRKRWYIVAVLAIIGASVAFAQAHASPPQYRAQSTVFVSIARGSTTQELVQGSTFTQEIVGSYAKLATMPVVLDQVIYDLDLDTTPKALAEQITAENPLDTVIIEIDAVATTSTDAAELANGVADELTTTITNLSPSSNKKAAVEVTVVARAEPPEEAFAPRTRLAALVGFAAGFGLGVAIAVVRALLDTRVRSAAELEQLTDVGLLGAIPRRRGKRSRGAVTAIDPHNVAAEAYRRLQTNLQFLDASLPVRSMVVTSSIGGEGKSTTSINLALAIAEQGQRVLLVDADMRRPAVADYCGLEGAAGLTTVLIGKAELADVVQVWGDANLNVLTMGEIPPNPAQLLGSPRMVDLLEEARAAYDVVILDSPPLLPVADGAILSRLTDGALVVANCRTIHRPQVLEAIDSLENVDARCLGIVANQVRDTAAHTYYGQPEQTWFSRLLARFGRTQAQQHHHPAAGV
ncbi:capsular exopolysaccharide synthesis family protein [Nocardioides luteus]|uniref:non-specific protein-tyrosine kinase n=1 Tax=Nocardioides luteus TaxID=1844 RepID=A0ABQ5SXM8_9ACTN|nr:polysaccharide biosynthesis tyrosine autokinase [Nocardioides luteus]MDR7309276.1 capsular exopolysaccharide synthesis family protein [Nocardioides luteus]GGR48607.1 chromosome partitioning protein [Nocardioides luteus]GLJ67681.1 chromosome partitioning protein [Nocardioides luteus]